MECQRLMKRIKYLEAACYACPDYQKQLDGLKKKTKKRLIDVKRALQAGAPCSSHAVSQLHFGVSSEHIPLPESYAVFAVPCPQSVFPSTGGGSFFPLF